MKKPKKLKKLKTPALPSVPKLTKQSFKRVQAAEQKVDEALSNVPRITNETVADHREEVLKSARKYIYPLQHSKHRVVRISIGLFIAVVIAFFAYCGLSLYKFQSTSGFMYAITQVVPFPVAKAGDSWVSYESYLFELRRNMHYYQTQQQTNFKSPDGKAQLKRLKAQAMDQVVRDAYVKQLAKANDVSVGTKEVNTQLELVRNENRLGSNDRVFKEVLSEFWGWDESDFRRELQQQLLQQAVVAKLDTATANRARDALSELKSGADFAKVALAESDDFATKTTGGVYTKPITRNDRDIAPALTDALFKLKAGQLSPQVVNAGYTLEILKVIDKSGDSLHAAHIQFNLKPITAYTNPLQAKHHSRAFIKVAS